MEHASADHLAKIYACLKPERHCTLATSGVNGQPETATVGFSETEALEIIFATWKWTRKYENLQHDNRVSFVFGFEKNVNIQYEGRAAAISKTDPLVRLYLLKKPHAERNLDDPEYIFFKVAPSWLRYTDFSVNPYESFELNY